MVCFHKTPYLYALLGFLQKSYVSMALEKAALVKNSANNFLWINIEYGVEIRDFTCMLQINFKLIE